MTRQEVIDYITSLLYYKRASSKAAARSSAILLVDNLIEKGVLKVRS